MAYLISIGIIIIMAGRLFSNYSSKNNALGVVNKIKKNPDYSLQLASTLDMQFYKRNLSNHLKVDSKLPIEASNKIGDFTINFCKEIEKGRYLFCTLAEYEDVEARRGGNITVKKFMDLNFILEVEDSISTQEIKLYSDLYDNLIDKNLRTDFANALYNHLTV